MKSKQNIFKYNYRQLKYLPIYDYYPYMWYRGHRLLFQSLIFKGRKLWAFNFLGELKYELKVRESIDPFWSFLIGLMKIMPLVILFPKRVSGVIQGVPLPIIERKQYTYAIKWIVKVIRDKFRVVSLSKVADSLALAIYEKGDAFETKVGVYKVAVENQHMARHYGKKPHYGKKR